MATTRGGLPKKEPAEKRKRETDAQTVSVNGIIWNICFEGLKKIFRGFERFILSPGGMYRNG